MQKPGLTFGCEQCACFHLCNGCAVPEHTCHCLKKAVELLKAGKPTVTELVNAGVRDGVFRELEQRLLTAVYGDGDADSAPVCNQCVVPGHCAASSAAAAAEAAAATPLPRRRGGCAGSAAPRRRGHGSARCEAPQGRR